MSMSLYVFSDKEVNSIAEWQAAINAEGYPLQLSAEMIFERLSGFFPMHLRGELTGFECYHEDVADVVQASFDIKLDHAWKFVLGFVWLGSKENELLAAWMAATAYARVTNGVILDGEGMKFLTPAQARTIVHDLEHPSPETLAAIREIKERLSRKT
jgi:hypothetical protein